eukprot:4254847-Alexandrium_andersonii.AAC.1
MSPRFLSRPSMIPMLVSPRARAHSLLFWTRSTRVFAARVVFLYFVAVLRASDSASRIAFSSNFRLA